MKARTQPAKPEPEQSLWSRLSSWISGGSEPPATTTPAPDPTAVLDDARQRLVQELFEIISNVVRDWRERREAPRTPHAATSRSYRDERWPGRGGLGPTQDHDHNQQHGR